MSGVYNHIEHRTEYRHVRMLTATVPDEAAAEVVARDLSRRLLRLVDRMGLNDVVVERDRQRHYDRADWLVAVRLVGYSPRNYDAERLARRLAKARERSR